MDPEEKLAYLVSGIVAVAFSVWFLYFMLTRS